VQNDDDDIVYMYTGYVHKLMMCFLSHPTSRDKVRIVPQCIVDTCHMKVSTPSALELPKSFIIRDRGCSFFRIYKMLSLVKVLQWV
jgi:hypothetical protein